MRVFLTGASGFIGTNLVEALLRQGHQVCNYDSAEPLCNEHGKYWVAGDVLDEEALRNALVKDEPEWVIHLAARTDCDETTTVERGYAANTVGTRNLLAAVSASPTVKRLAITSSQYVCGPGRQPEHEEDFFPHTVYGWSKVETEKLTRSAELPCTWLILRPVNIWGPYHERYAREFWRVAARGWYVHPDVPAPVRTYGYIGNVVWQILALLESPASAVQGRVFYVGDQPIRIDKWSIGFYRALRGREPPRVPMWMMRGLAKAGDVVSLVTRRPFFITSSRLRSMTLDYQSPIDGTVALIGEAPYSLEEGIEQTVHWYQNTQRS